MRSSCIAVINNGIPLMKAHTTCLANLLSILRGFLFESLLVHVRTRESTEKPQIHCMCASMFREIRSHDCRQETIPDPSHEEQPRDADDSKHVWY